MSREARVGCCAAAAVALIACAVSGAGTASRGSAHSSGTRIEEIRGVDVGELTDAERETWIELVNSELSPCGEPVSIARCAGAGSCRSCRVAARYLRRLLLEGYDRDTIEEHYEGRFGPKGVVPFALGDSPVRGSQAHDAMTLVVFSDFQCPHCGRAHPTLVRLWKEHPDRVRLVFRHFPLAGHPRAFAAACAAEAARNQDRFWEMHDRLFEDQDALEDADFERHAEALGLDLARFRTDVTSAAVRARVEADVAEGARVGVDGTPALFVAGRRFREPLRALGDYVREELDR